jgi:Carboxypeptidase regulatory-like domain
MLIGKHFRFFVIATIVVSAIAVNAINTFALACDSYPPLCVMPSFYGVLIPNDNIGNTGQVGEPRLVNPLDTTALTTVWYQWTPPVSGIYYVDTSRGGQTINYPTSPVNTELAVYRDTNSTFAGLVKLGANDDWFQFAPVIQDFSNCFPERPVPMLESSNKSCIKFTAVVGQQYAFQIDSSGNSPTGDVFLYTGLIATVSSSPASINGRVTNENGRGISRTIVLLTDLNGNTRTATTNPFGYYRFLDIESGQNYTLVANRKGYQFENNPRVINVSDNIEGENFVGSNPFLKR